MGNSIRHTRINSKRVVNRKRKLLKNWMFHLVRVLVLVMLVFYIKSINSQLEELQTLLKRIEVLQYGAVETSSWVQEEVDYVSSIGVVNVEKPIQRTSSQILERLSELGQSDPVIKEIYSNYSQYPENLMAALANNPEMADFVAGYLEERGNAARGLTRLEKEQDFPLFLQWDPRWGYQSYGTDNIWKAGCGPTCLSMVLFYLTRDEKLTPDKIAAYSMEKGYYVEGTGTAWALMEDVPKLYDIKVTNPRVSERAMKSVLDSGGIIICSMGEGDFTVSGHFIVIYGYDENGFMVNDPNCVARSRRRWSFDELEQQMKNIWAYDKESK